MWHNLPKATRGVNIICCKASCSWTACQSARSSEVCFPISAHFPSWRFKGVFFFHCHNKKRGKWSRWCLSKVQVFFNERFLFLQVQKFQFWLKWKNDKPLQTDLHSPKSPLWIHNMFSYIMCAPYFNINYRKVSLGSHANYIYLEFIMLLPI